MTKKKTDPVLEGLRGVTHVDASVRVEAYRALTTAGALDMLDLREVASIAAWSMLHDTTLDVRIAAAELVRHRAGEGYDAGFGVAAARVLLATLDVPEALRALAHDIVRDAERRTPTARWFDEAVDDT